ncbi:MAG: YceI family protein [Candidatus Krumholzibacteriota bacterium]
MNTKSYLSSIFLLLLLATLAGPLAAAEYLIDSAHSTIGFQVRHMAISKTNGHFRDFTGSFSFEPGRPDGWSCEAVIQAESISTDNQKRDDHLRSDEFLDVANFPTLTFKSTGVELENDSEGVLKGDLTLHGVTKSVELDLEFLGTVTDPWGNDRAGFSASLTINRKDFGLTYHTVMEAGGLVVGDKVKITLEIEGILNKD